MKEVWRICGIVVSGVYFAGCNGDEHVSGTQASATASSTSTASITSSTSGEEFTSTEVPTTSTSSASSQTVSGGMTSTSSETDSESTTGEPLPSDTCIPEEQQKYNEVGEGTSDRPYLICSAAQLASMRMLEPQDIEAVYSLVADIDLQPYYEQEGSPFQIAQKGYTYKFSGEFYGNNHRIRNFQFVNTQGQGGGLFSYAADGFKIVDLQLENFSVDSQSNAGLLIDSIDVDEDLFMLENIKVMDSKIRGSHRIGGVIGVLIAVKGTIDGSQSAIKNIYVENIYIEMNHYNLFANGFGSLGGLAGVVGSSNAAELTSNFVIVDSSVSGKMIVSPKKEQLIDHEGFLIFTDIGGVIGHGSRLDLKNTHVSMDLDFAGDYQIVRVGGLAGNLSLASQVENSLDNKINLTSWYNTSINELGGLVGGLSKQSQLRNVSLTDSHIQAYVATYCGGLAGLSTDSSIEASSVMTSTIQCGKFGGGLVGTAEHSTIETSFSQNSKLSFNNYITGNGGLVGQLKEQSLLSRSFAQDQVTEANSFGGLVGNCITGSRIENSYVHLHASTLSGDGIAGLVYSAENCEIENTYVAGSLNKVNWNNHIAENVSGFVSFATHAKISNSWSNVSFTGVQYDFTSLGGFVSDMLLPMTVSSEDIYWVQDPEYQKIQCMSALLQDQKNVQEPIGCKLLTDENFKNPAHPVYQTWDPMIWNFIPGEFPTLQ